MSPSPSITLGASSSPGDKSIPGINLSWSYSNFSSAVAHLYLFYAGHYSHIRIYFVDDVDPWQNLFVFAPGDRRVGKQGSRATTKSRPRLSLFQPPAFLPSLGSTMPSRATSRTPHLLRATARQQAPPRSRLPSWTLRPKNSSTLRAILGLCLTPLATATMHESWTTSSTKSLVSLRQMPATPSTIRPAQCLIRCWLW